MQPTKRRTKLFHCGVYAGRMALGFVQTFVDAGFKDVEVGVGRQHIHFTVEADEDSTDADVVKIVRSMVPSMGAWLNYVVFDSTSCYRPFIDLTECESYLGKDKPVWFFGWPSKGTREEPELCSVLFLMVVNQGSSDVTLQAGDYKFNVNLLEDWKKLRYIAAVGKPA